MTHPGTNAVETPSGKDADYENFPVGSWLLPARLRPHIACYYRFARAIDDIADNPDLAPDVKLARLDGFQSAIRGQGSPSDDYRTGHEMRASLLETNVTEQHCLDLISAFKQDALKSRYENWQELVDYCLLSAAPVGRYLIDLHGGSINGYGPSDALCIALQVINHMQDCKEDYETMDRVYIPLDWMKEKELDVSALSDPQLSAPMRDVLNQVLRATEKLMPVAKQLPGGLKSRRLAAESQVIIHIADRLIEKLKQEDPLADRVKLSKATYIWCCLRGLSGAFKPGSAV